MQRALVTAQHLMFMPTNLSEELPKAAATGGLYFEINRARQQLASPFPLAIPLRLVRHFKRIIPCVSISSSVPEVVFSNALLVCDFYLVYIAGC